MVVVGQVWVSVVGGNGGNGSITFRREKFVPRGGPDGGDGGKGGDVYVVGDPGKEDLSSLQYVREVEGGRGGDGGKGKRYGKTGKERTVSVPTGTVVWEGLGNGEKEVVGEVVEPGERLLISKGGRGGRGNVKRVSATNRVPLLAEEGEKGERRDLYLEHWPFVDVGLVSLPNAGKSQLLHAISRATPPISEYPFCTTDPVFGSVQLGWEPFIIVEVPSLCQGAYEGKGLGNNFLTSVMRTRLLLYLLDGESQTPLDDLCILQEEVRLYNETLSRKPVAIAVNKIDLPEVREKLPELRRILSGQGMSLSLISARTGEGVETLKATLNENLANLPGVTSRLAPPPKRIHLLEPKPSVTKEGAVFVVVSPQAERLVALPDLRLFQARLQLRRELDKLGVLQALIDAGVKSGNAVRIGSVELEWE
ncbi:MAG: GTPase ObgE [Chloroflexi bacterium]|nr:GTPase ObgE [Chloroflexota bacterium]